MITDIEKIETVEKIEKESNEITAATKALKIVDAESYKESSLQQLKIKAMIKTIHATFDPICQKTDEAHKEAVKQRAKFLDPLEADNKLIDSFRREYDRAEDRRVQAEQARIDAEAKKEADRLATKADKAEAKGDTAKAEELRMQSEQAEAIKPIVQKEVPKIDGVRKLKEIWKHEVVDLNLLMKWIIETKNEEGLIIGHDKNLGGIARVSHDKRKIPGVRFYRE